eukprot:1918115-Amphidinium_carterae.1
MHFRFCASNQTTFPLTKDQGWIVHYTRGQDLSSNTPVPHPLATLRTHALQHRQSLRLHREV